MLRIFGIALLLIAFVSCGASEDLENGQLVRETMERLRDAPQRDIPLEEAIATLQAAVENPPAYGPGLDAALEAMFSLAGEEGDDAIRVLTLICEDPHQRVLLRSNAFIGLRRSPHADIARLRKHLTEILSDASGHDGLRQMAADTLGDRRVATDATRVLLERTLFRSGEDEEVQLACLDALAETTPTVRMRELLSRDELRTQQFFPIRVHVVCGLATLRVRTRETLEYLCKLMEEADPRDQFFLVQQEAILSFWILTGRAPGVAAERKALFANVPAPYEDEADLRTHMWDFRTIRKGVTEAMLEAVEDVTGKNDKNSRWIRNDEGLKAAVEFARKELDAIEAEWARRKGPPAKK